MNPNIRIPADRLAGFCRSNGIASLGQSDQFWHGIQAVRDFRQLAGEKQRLIQGIRPASTLAPA